MERKRKKENRRSHMRNRLLCYLLSGALALTNLAIMPTLTVSAAGLSEQDNGNQEELQPNVVVSNYDELVQAIDESENGDIIGIDRIISICNDEDYLGAADKHITILKMSYNAYFEIAQSVRLTIRNLTFDGNRSKFNTRNTNPMLSANSNIIFQNVIIQNCYSQSGGAGLCVYSGVINTHNCIFRDNHAIDGGHIKVFNTSTVNIRNTELTKGEANSDGGAIYISGETATVNFINSKIYGNQATGVGGGIKNNGKTFLKDTIIYGNTADCGADIANTMYAKFQIEEMDKLVKIYESASLLPKSWIVDFDTDNRMPPHLIDLSQEYALVKLDYEEIPEGEKPDDKTDDIQDTGDSSVNGESKGDGNKEDNNGSNPAADNKDNTDENNTDDSNSGQGNSEEGTAAADSEKENDNKGNDSIGNNENQENQEDNNENQSNQDSLGNDENKDGSSSDSNLNGAENPNNNMPYTSTENGNQTSNPSIEKPNTDNNGSSSGSTTPSSEGNKQPDSIVNNGNQGGSSVGNNGNNSSNNNQNQPNKPVSGAVNSTTNGNASDNTNGGSGSSLGNGNVSDNTSQSGENVPAKPENNQGNNSGSSDNGGTAAITDNTQISVSDNNTGSSDNKNVVKKKKAIKKLTVIAKRGKGKISGKTIKKAAIKIRIGKKTYKSKSNAKGKFTIKLKGKAKLKKGQKIKITVSKKGYKTRIKTVKVK